MFLKMNEVGLNCYMIINHGILSIFFKNLEYTLSLNPHKVQQSMAWFHVKEIKQNLIR